MFLNAIHRLLKWSAKAKTILVFFTAYISIAGIYTFTAFILEESVQMTTFASWGIEKTGNYGDLYRSYMLMSRINLTLKRINTFLGWIQPLAYLSYSAFHDATSMYLRSMESKLLLNAPNLLDGKTISLTFNPDKITTEADKTILSNGHYIVYTDKRPLSLPVQVEGKLRAIQGKIIIDTRKDKKWKRSH